jgi:peroxiredoxin
MKKFFLYCFTIVLLTQCTQSTKFQVNGSVDLKDESEVYLIKVGDNNRPQPIDTLQVTEGAFSFSGDAAVPEMHYLFFEGIRGNLPFVLEKGTITIIAYKDSLRSSLVKGTPSNRDFADYLKGAQAFGKDLNRIQMEMRSPAVIRDSLAQADLKEQFDAMIEKLTQYELNFVNSNTDSYISSLVLERMLMNKSIETEEAKTIYSSFSESVKETKSAQSIQKILFPDSVDTLQNEEVSIGSTAPDFSAPSPNGQIISLKEVASNSKITIIDFWASWCRPCRIENPVIVAMYNKYKDAGLNVIGVSLDKNADKWKEAIEADNLTWPHVSNLKYWQDPIAATYNVNSIPRTFIVDQNLTILSEGLRGKELEDKVAELLAL